MIDYLDLLYTRSILFNLWYVNLLEIWKCAQKLINNLAQISFEKIKSPLSAKASVQMKEADESAKSGFCLVLGDLHRFVGTRSGLSIACLKQTEILFVCDSVLRLFSRIKISSINYRIQLNRGNFKRVAQGPNFCFRCYFLANLTAGDYTSHI